MAANPFSSPHAFESPASREQRISAEIAWHQSPIPALGNPPMRAQSAYFKTRMCVRFLSAFCPKGGNCNFAHSIEELRRPQGNGDGRALFPREDGGARNGHIPRTCSEHSGLSEEQKLHKGNYCRKPYNGEICSNGDRCSFTHVQPGSFQDSSVVNQKSLSWKTKICHKWLTFGNCPYGDQCCYAHGDAELRKLGGCHGELLVEKNVDAAPTNFTPDLTDDDALSKKRKRVLLEPSSALESQQQIRVLTLKKSNGIYGDWINDIV